MFHFVSLNRFVTFFYCTIKLPNAVNHIITVAVSRVTLVGSMMSCFKLKSSYKLEMCFVLLCNAWSDDFLARSQCVSPRRIVSFPSLSRKARAFFQLIKGVNSVTWWSVPSNHKKGLAFGWGDFNTEKF